MRFVLSFIVLVAAWTARAQGSSEAILGYTNAITGGFNGTAGWTFETAAGVSVTELGCLANFFSANPVTEIQVGLWAPDGSILASNTISATSPLVNLSRYEAVAPVSLTPGVVYHIGVFVQGTSFGLDVVAPSVGGAVFTSPEIVSLNAAYGTNGFASPPIVPGSPGAAFLGPNFRYQGGVPEPAGWLLLSLGALFLAARRLTRRS